MRVLKGLFFIILTLAFVGCGSPDAAAPAEGGDVEAAVEAVEAADTMNAAAIEAKFTASGVDFTKQDDMDKRASMFSATNQPAIDALTKFKFGSSSIQLSVVDLNDADRQAFVGNDLLAMYNQLVAADASYERGFTLTLEDANTALLMVFKTEDKELADNILAAMK